MRIHLIAVGGSIMHNLAMALQGNGHAISGSDDEVYEPSRSRLEKHGLLPDKMGWDPSRITKDIDIVILGMHARKDNPELQAALDNGIKVMSFPQYIYEASKDKQRIVVAGSHGKTSTTSMIMHALRKKGLDFDYLVGAIIPGFDLMVKVSDAPFIVIEGDEYLSSAIDKRPKIFHYRPHITAITGVAWDHKNVFPTKADYVSQFASYLDTIPEGCKTYLFARDNALKELANSAGHLDIQFYDALQYDANGVIWEGELFPMSVFGRHNFENMCAAMMICNECGLQPREFLENMSDFTGADMRLQTIIENDELIVYRDFAHAPSKVKSTVEAVREHHPGSHLTALLELHTFSSLSKDFIQEYYGSLYKADSAIVFYSPHTVEMKRLEPISIEEVRSAFGGNVEVCTSKDELLAFYESAAPGIHLWMSSGRFGGIDITNLYK